MTGTPRKSRARKLLDAIARILGWNVAETESAHGRVHPLAPEGEPGYEQRKLFSQSGALDHIQEEERENEMLENYHADEPPLQPHKVCGRLLEIKV